MLAAVRCAVALYVDRPTQQWVVRDPDGQFWILPAAEDAWEQRQPYEPQPDGSLEAIPSHYAYLLRLPF